MQTTGRLFKSTPCQSLCSAFKTKDCCVQAGAVYMTRAAATATVVMIDTETEPGYEGLMCVGVQVGRVPEEPVMARRAVSQLVEERPMRQVSNWVEDKRINSPRREPDYLRMYKQVNQSRNEVTQRTSRVASPSRWANDSLEYSESSWRRA